MTEEIQKQLFGFQNLEYQSFHSKLIPNIDPGTIIGVRIPILRKYAKQLSKEKDVRVFLHTLPHDYYEENNLHGFLIELIKDYDQCIEEIDRFLPYVDNWATCDIIRPKVFKKHLPQLLEKIREWIASDHTYTIRFGIEMLMSFYLDDAFEEEYLQMVAEIRSEEYYVNMMIAWYFATALAKQYESAICYLEHPCMDVWTHNKAIQKAIESNRITKEQKDYLRSLKIRK